MDAFEFELFFDDNLLIAGHECTVSAWWNEQDKFTLLQCLAWDEEGPSDSPVARLRETNDAESRLAAYRLLIESVDKVWPSQVREAFADYAIDQVR